MFKKVFYTNMAYFTQIVTQLDGFIHRIIHVEMCTSSELNNSILMLYALLLSVFSRFHFASLRLCENFTPNRKGVKIKIAEKTLNLKL